MKPGQTPDKEEKENVEKIKITIEEDIEKRLFESLKKHELPDYLLYTGTGGAKNWLKLDGSETFPVARQLKVLLEKNIASIVRFIPTGMSLVSVGVGSGDKEKILLEELINQIAGGYPNLKDGVCKGRPPLSWNCLVFYDKTSLT